MSIELTNPVESARSECGEKNGLRKTARVIPLRYGLPCVNCRLYYDADFNTCPICGCNERVSPTT
jgi:rRNA maturation endonuclease Nob1